MKISSLILLVVVALSICALASADVTAVQTYSDPSVYPGYTNTGYPYTFSVTPFNPSLGTLNEVILTYQAQWQGSFSFVNIFPGSDMQGSQQLTFTLAENTNTLEDLSANSGEFDFGATPPIYGFTPTDNWSGSTSGTTDVTTNLADWQGGTVGVLDTFYGTASLDVPGIGTEAPGSASESAGVQFGVQYQYEGNGETSTPEPSTVALGLMALGMGVGMWRRRRGSRK